jgi:hypothetical protein
MAKAEQHADLSIPGYARATVRRYLALDRERQRTVEWLVADFARLWPPQPKAARRARPPQEPAAAVARLDATPTRRTTSQRGAAAVRARRCRG